MYEILLIAHLVMIATATGMAFSHLVILRVSSGQAGERAAALALARRTVADFTTMVVVFVWISGLMLLWSRYGESERVVSAWFYAKLGFVGLLTGAHVMQRLKALHLRGETSEEGRASIELWVAVVWLSALMAIVFAVISFAAP